MKKLVLAYSGGLDTSFCAKLLSENYEVHAVCVNTGGFSNAEIKSIEKKAFQLGVFKFICIDATTSYYQRIIKYLVFGNVLKNNTYPLSVSAERIIQSVEIVNYSQKVNAPFIAHGSTGAGNDQVRFDMIFQTLLPDIKIITPIRDRKLSREEEIDYLKSHGINIGWQKAKYSINKGLWGTSIGGEETLGSRHPLPEEAYPSQLTEKDSKEITLTFEKGELTAVNNQKNTPVNNIILLNNIACKYAIGRDIHVGDTIVGIKGRVGFEAAAPLIIIKAHHLLEKHCLTKWQQIHKDYLSQWYGNLLHEGQYLDPVMRNIESFLSDSQKYVSGNVFIKLSPYRFELNGIKSEMDLMNSAFASYGESNNTWNSEEVKGFIKLLSTQNNIFNSIHHS